MTPEISPKDLTKAIELSKQIDQRADQLIATMRAHVPDMPWDLEKIILGAVARKLLRLTEAAR